MDLEAWTVDLKQLLAVHSSGFRLVVEGDPANPSGVNPGKFPEGLSAVQQAGLLRCGVQAVMDAAQKARSNMGGARFIERAPHLSEVVTPKRPLLKLKR